MMADLYFDEIIKVVKINSEVVYDKVSRINAKSEDDDFYLELDVHTELYPMLPGEKYRMVISKSLLMDGSAVAGYFPEGKSKSLADKFEYVMHGLLYKMAESEDKTGAGDHDVQVYVYATLWFDELFFRYGIAGRISPLVVCGSRYKPAIFCLENYSDNWSLIQEVYISFGGLQLMLKGDPLKMHKFKVDEKLFLLLRKM